MPYKNNKNPEQYSLLNNIEYNDSQLTAYGAITNKIDNQKEQTDNVPSSLMKIYDTTCDTMQSAILNPKTLLSPNNFRAYRTKNKEQKEKLLYNLTEIQSCYHVFLQNIEKSQGLTIHDLLKIQNLPEYKSVYGDSDFNSYSSKYDELINDYKKRIEMEKLPEIHAEVVQLKEELSEKKSELNYFMDSFSDDPKFKNIKEMFYRAGIIATVRVKFHEIRDSYKALLLNDGLDRNTSSKKLFYDDSYMGRAIKNITEYMKKSINEEKTENIIDAMIKNANNIKINGSDNDRTYSNSKSDLGKFVQIYVEFVVIQKIAESLEIPNEEKWEDWSIGHICFYHIGKNLCLNKIQDDTSCYNAVLDLCGIAASKVTDLEILNQTKDNLIFKGLIKEIEKLAIIDIEKELEIKDDFHKKSKIEDLLAKYNIVIENLKSLVEIINSKENNLEDSWLKECIQVITQYNNDLSKLDNNYDQDIVINKLANIQAKKQIFQNFFQALEPLKKKITKKEQEIEKLNSEIQTKKASIASLNQNIESNESLKNETNSKLLFNNIFHFQNNSKNIEDLLKNCQDILSYESNPKLPSFSLNDDMTKLVIAISRNLELLDQRNKLCDKIRSVEDMISKFEEEQFWKIKVKTGYSIVQKIQDIIIELEKATTIAECENINPDFYQDFIKQLKNLIHNIQPAVDKINETINRVAHKNNSFIEMR